MANDTIMQLTYCITDRSIQNGQIQQTTTYDSIILKQRTLIIKEKRYPLTQVYDVSYRNLSPTLYLFYLYTISGVLTFSTFENPEPFKQAIQKQMKHNLFL